LIMSLGADEISYRKRRFARCCDVWNTCVWGIM